MLPQQKASLTREAGKTLIRIELHGIHFCMQAPFLTCLWTNFIFFSLLTWWAAHEYLIATELPTQPQKKINEGECSEMLYFQIRLCCFLFVWKQRQPQPKIIILFLDLKILQYCTMAQMDRDRAWCWEYKFPLNKAVNSTWPHHPAYV